VKQIKSEKKIDENKAKPEDVQAKENKPTLETSTIQHSPNISHQQRSAAAQHAVEQFLTITGLTEHEIAAKFDLDALISFCDKYLSLSHTHIH
jgi:hypothetical protein